MTDSPLLTRNVAQVRTYCPKVRLVGPDADAKGPINAIMVGAVVCLLTIPLAIALRPLLRAGELELGADPDFVSVPPAMGWWLGKRGQIRL